MGYSPVPLFLLVLVFVPLNCHSWGGWFSSSRAVARSEGGSFQATRENSNGFVAEFSMETLTSPRGAKLVENARRKLADSNSCWSNAYSTLFAGCSEILAAEEKRSRFAWYLSDCFQRDSGRPAFPRCDEKSSMVDCRKKLDESERMVYLEFYLETNSICHQLQTHAFKQETERLVNDLKKSAESAEDKLEIIQDRSDSLFHRSNEIQDSLISIDSRTQQVAQASKNVQDHIEEVLHHSEAIYEQSRGIAASQSELRERQEKMKEQIEDGMAKILESSSSLGREIDSLRKEAGEIEKEINKVRDGMFSKMEDLQGKADDIGDKAGISLEKQKQLLDGQSTALKGLQFLTKFQSEALEESRSTLQQLAEYSSRQQEELLQRQEQLQRVHDNLVENSKSILAAQEAFESKQATMFVALDKLFALHNAMLLESRIIKAFFLYSLSIFIIYMFTSTKQTYTVRPWLYIGLCITFVIEVFILRFTTMGIEEQAWIINLFRSFFAVVTLAQLLYAILTYRDYEVLNHQILLALVEKVNGLQRENKLPEDLDSDVNWLSWMDTELPEEADINEDPDFLPPEEVGENSITTNICTRRYNLRRRFHI
ncbi:protein GAMETE EXPRESSED 1 [Rhodamnia argentea]|uniref:Protein GAMETE EXPRESSED 1 n=1 Tax=Rhodamnia argentea TaxID=178133 RepID=A0A8B8NCR1_9MYRT|nr:protein GAMETE EXPRESSED 1 [Rhodamnia argentea]